MSRSVRGHTLAVTLLLVGATAAGAQPTREATGTWAFRKPITVPALTGPAFVELRLDADVVRESTPTLADLRVRDDSGADVAYTLRRRERTTGTQTRDTQ
jgi:hypothetical protein